MTKTELKRELGARLTGKPQRLERLWKALPHPGSDDFPGFQEVGNAMDELNGEGIAVRINGKWALNVYRPSVWPLGRE